jgi:hypothetical protein
MHHDVIALSKDTLGLNVVSGPFSFYIGWRAHYGAGDIREISAKCSLSKCDTYYAYYTN